MELSEKDSKADEISFKKNADPELHQEEIDSENDDEEKASTPCMPVVATDNYISIDSSSEEEIPSRLKAPKNGKSFEEPSETATKKSFAKRISSKNSDDEAINEK